MGKRNLKKVRDLRRFRRILRWVWFRNLLGRIKRFLKRIFSGVIPTPKPGPLTVIKIREDFSMPNKFGYTISIPPVGAPDVVERTLTVIQAGAGTEAITLALDAAEYEIIVDQDAAVSVSLVDTDDAGNASEPSTLDFVATDTVAPPVPGALGVVSVREIFEEEPPVE